MFLRLTKIMTDSFTSCIAKLTASIEAKFDSQVAESFALATRVDRIERRLDEMTAVNKSLSDKVLSLTKENEKLTLSLDNIEQYSRADSLLVHGLPLPPPGNAENLYCDIPSVLNRLIPTMRLTPECISVTHRLPSPSLPSHASGPPLRPPPVVVRFGRRQTRTILMQSRKALKGQHVVLTDHLTPSRAALLKKASALVTAQKILSAWSQDGKLLIKSLLNRTSVIQTEADLLVFN